MYTSGETLSGLGMLFAAAVVAGRSWPGHLALAASALAVAALLLWVAIRRSRSCVRTGPDGVDIVGAWGTRHLPWERIQGFEAAILGTGTASVLARTGDGGKVVLSPLRWDGLLSERASAARLRQARQVAEALDRCRAAAP